VVDVTPNHHRIRICLKIVKGKVFLFFSERYEKEHSTVLAVFEEAMAVGFSTPASYLEVREVSKMPPFLLNCS
jgi:hypothetical protein